MTESLLLQETGSGYFTLENDTGRILLEISSEGIPAGLLAGRQARTHRQRLRRDDDEVALMAAHLLT